MAQFRKFQKLRTAEKLFIAFFLASQHGWCQQQLETFKLHTLDQEYSNCEIVVADVTMVACQSMSYLYKSGELVTMQNINDTGLIIQGEVSCAKESYESVNSGGITYLMNTNEVFKAKINNTSNKLVSCECSSYLFQFKIESELLFTIPINSGDTQSPQVQEVLVTDNYTLVRYDNFTVAAYFRPKTKGGVLIRSKSGSMTLSQNQDSPLFYFTPVLNQQTGALPTSHLQLQLFVTPNSVSGNTLMQYQIYQTFNAQGILTDIQIQVKQTLSLGSLAVSSLAGSQYYLLIGCSQCNYYKGRTDIYNRSALSSANGKLGQIDGTSDNQMLGQDLKVISSTPKGFAQFHIGSNSGGTPQSRLNFVNILRVFKNVTNASSPFTFEFNKQAIKGLVAAPQSGLQVGVYKEEYLIIKFGYSRYLYGSQLCHYSKSYSSVDMNCNACQSGLTLYMQQSSPCTTCDSFKSSVNNTPTSFQQNLYQDMCFNTQSSVSQQKTTSNTTNSTATSTNTSTQNTIVPQQNQTVNSTNTTAQSTNNTNTTKPINNTNTTQSTNNTNTTSTKNATATNQTMTNTTTSSTNTTKTNSTQNNQTTVSNSTTTNSTTKNATTNNQSSASNQTQNSSTSNSTQQVNSTTKQNNTSNTTSNNQTSNATQSTNGAQNQNSSNSSTIENTTSQSTDGKLSTNGNETTAPNENHQDPNGTLGVEQQSNSTDTPNNTTRLQIESEQAFISSKIMLPVIVCSTGLAIIIASILIWCCLRKRSKKRKNNDDSESNKESSTAAKINMKGKDDLESRNESEKEQHSGARPDIHSLPTKMDTQIGLTSEGLRTQRVYDNDPNLDGLINIDRLINEEDISPENGLRIPSPINQKEFNSETIRKELDKEVENIKNFFVQGPITKDNQGPDNHDLESSPTKISRFMDLRLNTLEERKSGKKTLEERISTASKQKYERMAKDEEGTSDSTQNDKQLRKLSQLRDRVKRRRQGTGLFADLENSGVDATDKENWGGDNHENNQPHNQIMPTISTQRTAIPDSNRQMIFGNESHSKKSHQKSQRKK